jgi:serine/threonine-protein kinase
MPGIAPVEVGDLIAGKYRIERVLGQGGMGIVVAARHEELGERVALKFLLGEAASDPERVARFLREARAAARIRNEHVARVTDVGRLDGGAPYMVMEFLEGHDLEARLAERGPLPLAEAVDYVLQACEALAEAHSIGIVHRDLKPANLFHVARPDGMPFVKVLDFGISKMNDPAGAGVQMTRTTAMLGSPLYMSPEHLKAAKDADQRADVWSLGVILYELVSGSVPFTAETIAHLGAKILNEPPTPLRSVRSDLPVAFEAVVNRCLQKDPRDRYQSVAELARAIGPFAQDSRRSVERIERTLTGGSIADAAPAAAPPAPAAEAAAQTAASWGSVSSTAQRSSKRGALIGAAVLAIVALGAIVVATRPSTAPPTSVVKTTPVALPAPAAPAVQAPAPAAKAPEAVTPVVAPPVVSAAPVLAPHEATKATPATTGTKKLRSVATKTTPRQAIVIPDDRK